MKKLPLIALLSLSLTLAWGDDLVTNDGKTYAEYNVVSHDADGISIWYKGGQATIPFDNLPVNIQKDYGYKPKEIDWKTDYDAAVQEAKANKKLLLLDFTGSDWCGYCQLLDKEVFPTEAFKAFARANFVCVTLDFPHGKELSSALKKQNDALKQKYDVRGFPSLVVIDTDGKELGRTTGYNPGSGPEAVISELKPFLSASETPSAK